jgi:predicted DsbA family dithiol-disulfide isomerase
VAVEWVPYELHPEIPKEGVDREAVLPAAYRQRVEAGMRRMAQDAGLRMASHERLINSRPALQAAEFARSVGRYDAMHAELFRAYWDAGQDVSSMPVLREVAARAGVDPDAMEAAVTADTYGDYLDARRQEAEELMITGIPAHVIADRYLVMGAQPYDVFERVMDRLGVARRPDNA